VVCMGGFLFGYDSGMQVPSPPFMFTSISNISIVLVRSLTHINSKQFLSVTKRRGPDTHLFRP
jgi:hypothetical protein